MDDVETTIRRAIGGDEVAIGAVLTGAADGDDARMVAMAAVLASRADWIERARALAVTSRDRQMVAIGASHVAGDLGLVRVLARDHLAEHPDSLIVAWIASLAHEGIGPPSHA
jgi:uncharacterized protein YbaP (TraB family)